MMVFRQARTKFFAHFGKKSTSHILFQLARDMANGRGNQINLPHQLDMAPNFGGRGDGFQLSVNWVSSIIEFYSIMFAKFFNDREMPDVNGWHRTCFRWTDASVTQESLKTI